MLTGILYMFVGAGMAWFGYCQLKEIRTIQDIPTSKIRSAAVGSNVEIKGRIVNETGEELIGPLSGKPCSFYYISIIVNHEMTAYFLSQKSFLIDDGSGSYALVDLNSAKLNIAGGAQIWFRGSKIPIWACTDGFPICSAEYEFDSIPPRLKKALEQHKKVLRKLKNELSSKWISKTIHFHEFSYSVNDPIYALGFAESAIKTQSNLKLSFQNFLKGKKLIQSDDHLQQKFDTNQDGRLDPHELEMGAKQVGRQLQDRSLLEEAGKPMPKAKLLLRGTQLHKLFISNSKEEHLTGIWSRLGYGALALYGGFFVILGFFVAIGWVVID